MGTLTVKMKHKKATPGTEVYEAVTPKDGETIRQVYIQKGAFDGSAPANIEVTVKVA